MSEHYNKPTLGAAAKVLCAADSSICKESSLNERPPDSTQRRELQGLRIPSQGVGRPAAIYRDGGVHTTSSCSNTQVQRSTLIVLDAGTDSKSSSNACFKPVEFPGVQPVKTRLVRTLGACTPDGGQRGQAQMDPPLWSIPRSTNILRPWREDLDQPSTNSSCHATLLHRTEACFSFLPLPPSSHPLSRYCVICQSVRNT